MGMRSSSGAFNYSLRTIPPLVSFGDYISEYLFAASRSRRPTPLFLFHRSLAIYPLLLIPFFTPPRRAASLAAYRRHRRFFFFFDCWLPGRYWRWLPTRSRVTDPSMRPTEYSGELAIYLIGPEPLRDSLGETSSLPCRESARTACSPRYGTGNRFLPGNDRYVMFLILWCTGVSRRISSTVEDLLEPKDKWFLYNNSRPRSVHWQYIYIVH